MRVVLTVLCLSFMASSAFASKYVNFIKNTAKISCHAVGGPYQPSKIEVVTTEDVVANRDGSTKSVQISSLDQSGKKQVTRKFIVKKVMVDWAEDGESLVDVVQRPTIVTGSNAKTGQIIKIEFKQNAVGNEGFGAGTIEIDGVKQLHLGLKCRADFAG